MTVAAAAVLSQLPALTPLADAPGTDASANGAETTDFAGLLLGQLAANTLPPPQLLADAAPKAEDDLAVGSDAVTDAAALFAALGLPPVAAAVRETVAPSATGRTETSDASPVQITLAAAEQPIATAILAPRAEDKDAPATSLTSNGPSASALPTPTGLNAPPARFAAALAEKQQATSVDGKPAIAEPAPATEKTTGMAMATATASARPLASVAPDPTAPTAPIVVTELRVLSSGKPNTTPVLAAEKSADGLRLTTSAPNAALLPSGNAPVSSSEPDIFLPPSSVATEKTAIIAASDAARPRNDIPLADSATTTTPTPAAQPATSAPANVLAHPALGRLETPLGAPSWGNDFSQRVVWLAGNDKHSAQLTLNPPNMGPIEISLNLSNDTASAFFSSPHAEVREAIQNAMPRLREMLAGVGVELGQTNVSSESFSRQPGSEDARHNGPRWTADNAILGSASRLATPAPAAFSARGNGLVDTFA